MYHINYFTLHLTKYHSLIEGTQNHHEDKSKSFYRPISSSVPTMVFAVPVAMLIVLMMLIVFVVLMMLVVFMMFMMLVVLPVLFLFPVLVRLASMTVRVVATVVPTVLRVFHVYVVHVGIVAPADGAVEIIRISVFPPLPVGEHPPELPVAVFPSVGINVATALDTVQIRKVDIQ